VKNATLSLNICHFVLNSKLKKNGSNTSKFNQLQGAILLFDFRWLDKKQSRVQRFKSHRA